MTALVDTNILVYRFDSRFPAKQRLATALVLRKNSRQVVLFETGWRCGMIAIPCRSHLLSSG
jgi:hypothetical protein